MLEEIQKTREYLNYIEEHYNNVQKAFKILNEKCKDMRFIWDDYCYFSLDYMVKEHDKSKLSEHEFIQYRKAFFPTSEEEKNGKYDMSEAWEHHKKENEHHWQSWTISKNSDPYYPELMCVHMIIDWMAMGIKMGDTAQEYYEKNKDEIKIPGNWVSFMYEIFNRIKE